MKKIFEIIKERKFKYICFFWILISIQFVIGGNLQTRGYSISDGKDFLLSLLKIIGLSVLFIVIHYFILELFNKVKRQKEEKNDNANKVNKEYKTLKYRWLVYFIIIIVCWIPTLLAFYPGLIDYDGGYQIRDCFFKGLYKHHPIIITKLYTSCYSIGVSASSPNMGILIFSLFQMSFMALVFSYSVKFIEEETQRKWVRNLSIIFYAIFPYNQLFSITTTKDVIFAGLVLTFLIHLYKNLKQKFKITDFIFMTIIGVLMLLSRNNAKYTIIVSLPIIAIVLFKDRKNLLKIVSLFLIIIFTYQITNSLLYQSIKYTTEEGQEVSPTSDEGELRINIFSQALGRLARDKKDELTNEEKERLSYYFKDYKKLGEKYRTNIADDSWSMVNSSKINENKGEFFKFVLELGKKYPITYMDSFLDTTRGFWYILDTSFSEIQTYKHPGALELYHFQIGSSDKYAVKLESKLPILRKIYMYAFCDNGYQNIPVLRVIFQPATYFYITLAFLLYVIYKRDKYTLVIVIFLFTFFASCFIANCSIIRYMYPVMVCTPLMMGLVLKKEGKEDNR